jgi:hypothetical protein
MLGSHGGDCNGVMLIGLRAFGVLPEDILCEVRAKSH